MSTIKNVLFQGGRCEASKVGEEMFTPMLAGCVLKKYRDGKLLTALLPQDLLLQSLAPLHQCNAGLGCSYNSNIICTLHTLPGLQNVSLDFV
jgi:hypothetical protein